MNRNFAAGIGIAGISLMACLGPDKTPDATPERAGAIEPVAFSTVGSGYSDAAIATGLKDPTQMEFAPDGRLFVSEQGGKLRVIKNGSLLSTPFLTVSVSTTGERGLLGIAFDPNYASQPYVYIMYTSPSGPHNKVSRFTASFANPDVADPASEKVLLDLPATLCDCGWHNGGGVHFGSDGKLYIAVGESTVGSRSQDMGTTMGKLLRINRDGTVPTDNPFYGQTSGSNRAIYALGFRNPYTFAVQPGTGRIFLNDVGASSNEEINDIQKGKNYGWPVKDGPINQSAYSDPYYYYGHSSGCAISGGAFYNPATVRFPSDFVGDYFFSDYCGNYIKKLDLAARTTTTFVSNVNAPSDVKVGNDGNLYYVARGAGEVRRVTSTTSQAPVIANQPANATVPVGTKAVFTVGASGPAPLAYQWMRNGANIGGATSASFTIAATALGDNGARFKCKVSNAAGSATSNEAVLTVINGHAPVATITAPADGAKYSGGTVINFSGKATDQEDGNLAVSRLTWEVRFFHNDGNIHSHSFVAPFSGAGSGSFTVPVQSETSPNVWYRIYLTAKDASGLASIDSLDVTPNKVSITLASSPSGLKLNLDGAAQTTPFTFTAVAGIQRNLSAPSPQSLGGSSYAFSSWSDGKAATHDISTPSANATFTATFSKTAATVYEAENASLSGPKIVSDWPGYTGTGFIDFQSPNGNWVEWTLNAATAGSKVMPIRYANVGDVKVSVTLNGSVIASSFTLPNTGGWGTWKTVNLTANLGAGTNKLRLTTINAGEPNIDNITLPEAAPPPATLYEAENASLSGPKIVSDWPGYTGTGFIDFQSPNGNWVEWTLNAATTGSKVIPIRYANVGDVKVSVTLNGTVIASSFTLPNTGGWGTWKTVTLTANLAAGTNKLRLTSINAGEPNIDNISVP